MMWKSYFRIQNFFSSFLHIPITFDTVTETFQVSPSNTLWRKIKRFLLTNLCLFAIWGVSIYRLLQQLLSSNRDENFTVLDVVIISIALAFCTEGLAHIWTFHFSARDICYVLTELLKLTKIYCYVHFAADQISSGATTGSTLSSYVNGKLIFNKLQQLPQTLLPGFGLLQPMDLNLKSIMQWEKHVQSLKNSFTSSRFHLSREEWIMNGIAIGFNGVPLVCFLTPLMTSVDPASYIMRTLVFPRSPTMAMLAASFFQGLTSFYASLLSLNLILICLTIVCEISAVFSTSYPTGNMKKSFVNGGASNNTNSNSSKNLHPWGKLLENSKNSALRLRLSGNRPEIHIDNYDKRNGAPTSTTSQLSSSSLEGRERKVEEKENGNKFAGCEHVFCKCKKKRDQNEDQNQMGREEKSKSTSPALFTQEQEARSSMDESNTSRKFSSPGSTSVFQVLSPKLDNQLELSSSPYFIPSQSEQTSMEKSFSNGKGETSNPNNNSSLASSPRTTSSSMLMMKIIEELGPAVVVKPPSAYSTTSSPTSSSSTLPIVNKLVGRIPSSLIVEPKRLYSTSEVLFVKSFKLYLQTKLLVLFINSAMFYYFPVVISVGMALTTLSAYSTVKLNSFLPLPIRLAILLVGLTVAAVMWLLMMESTEITRHTEEFIRYWKGRIKRDYFRKQLRTCQRLCFRIGPFIEFRKDTVFGVFSTIQLYTVNLALIKLI